MIVAMAEKSFQKGLASLQTGDNLEAMAYFEAAMRHQGAATRSAPNMKYQSYFGLCIAKLKGRGDKAIRLCQEAANAEFYNPLVFLNLGRVALIKRDRRTAYNAFRRGLEIDSSHRELRFELRQMGVRKRPLLQFLGRESVINKAVGQLRQPRRR
jgi:tetratricopeptide (TPR) repeat protein